METSEWLDVPNLKILSRHSSCVLIAAFMFYLVETELNYFLQEGAIKEIIIGMEDFIFLILFLWFIYQLGLLLWKNREKINNGNVLGVLLA